MRKALVDTQGHVFDEGRTGSGSSAETGKQNEPYRIPGQSIGKPHVKNCAAQCETSVFGEGQISQAEHYSRNTLPLLIFVCALCMAQGADAQFKVVDSGPPQAVFSGEDRAIRVLIENPTEQKLEMNVSTRLHQASSATSMPVVPNAGRL